MLKVVKQKYLLGTQEQKAYKYMKHLSVLQHWGAPNVSKKQSDEPSQSKWPPLKFVEYTLYSNAWDDDKKTADKQSCSLLGVGKF
jgi:hypothetical protein